MNTVPLSSAVVIRRLTAADSHQFHVLRLESLREAPTAFSTDGADEARMGADELASRLAREVVLGAECSGGLVGIVGLQRYDGPKHAHRGLVWGLYVVPVCRRNGIAQRLMHALETEAHCGIEVLELDVVRGNDAARSLYEKLGYSTYGMQPKALKINGAYYERILMYKELGDRTLGHQIGR
jgi:ribosomal protein S18 acetylase RimI-like enzyme